jgi:hypothetical protein
MSGLELMLGLGLQASGGKSAATVDSLVTRNAVNIFAAGYAGATLTASTGAAITKIVNFTNNSGAALAKASLCFAGFKLFNPASTGVSPWNPVGNDTPLTAQIAYPAGDQYSATGTPSTTVMTSGSVKANGYYDNGTLYFLNGTLAGTKVSPGNFTYTAASGTFTFSPALASAPAAADKFMVFQSTTQFTSMKKSGSTSLNVVNSSTMRTDGDTLPTPVPSLSTFSVIMIATTPNTQFYIDSSLTTPTHPGFGLFAVCTEALQSTLRKAMIFGIGDSIATNNGGVWNAVSAYLAVPSVHLSISGFRANWYAQSGGTYFQNIVDMVALAGATEVDSNLGTNDLTIDNNSTTTLNNILSLKTLLGSVPYIPATLTPSTSNTLVTASLVTSVGTTMTATVADATKFVVGRVYNVLGAVQTEYNGCKFCIARNTGLNTVDFLFAGSGTPTATGTITFGGGIGSASAGYTSRELQVPATGYEAGSSSLRALVNAGIRNTSNFIRCIEFGDAVELVRNDGIFSVGGDKSELDGPYGLCTVSSVVSTTRWNSNYAGNNVSSGTIQFVTGPNAGVARGASSSTVGDITVTSAFPVLPTVGDTFYVTTGSLRYASDSLHPQVAVGSIGAASYRGGQAVLTNAYIPYLQARL